jgi:hypothetical protein
MIRRQLVKLFAACSAGGIAAGRAVHARPRRTPLQTRRQQVGWFRGRYDRHVRARLTGHLYEAVVSFRLSSRLKPAL